MKRRILIVDDDPGILAVLKTSVRVHYPDYTVTVAGNGFSALERFQNMRKDGNIDLMLTDLQMPGLTGLQLAKIVKDNWPGVSIVLMTGSPNIETVRQQVADMQLDGFLTKPFTTKSLDKYLGTDFKSTVSISMEGH